MMDGFDNLLGMEELTLGTEWVDVNEAAKIYGCTTQHINAMRAKKKISFKEINGRYMYDRTELERKSVRTLSRGKTRLSERKEGE